MAYQPYQHAGALRSAMGDLEELGFTGHTFSEVVLALGLNGRVHIQPLGVKLGRGLLWARVFRTTRLYSLVSEGLRGSLNITYEPAAFFEPVFYGRPLGLEIAEGPLGPFLPSSSACVFIEVAGMEEERDFKIVYFRPLRTEVLRPPRAFNRAFPALLEALVYFSRARHFAMMGDAASSARFADEARAWLERLRRLTHDSSMLDMASELEADLSIWPSWAEAKKRLPDRGSLTLLLWSGRLREGFYAYTTGSGRRRLAEVVEECLSRGRAPGPIGDFTARPGVRYVAVIASPSREADRALGGGVSYLGPGDPLEDLVRAYRSLGPEPVVISFRAPGGEARATSPS